MLLVLALVAGASGAYLLFGDWLREVQYRGPVPTLLLDPAQAKSIAPVAISPERIVVEAAGVNTIIEPAQASEQLNRFTGNVVSTFPVPGGPFTTVWWEEGPAPGESGLAVILGHSRGQSSSVFGDLPDLEAGAVVGVVGSSAADDEVVARYLVTQVVTDIPKDDEGALRAVLDAAPVGATLALITCSGDIDETLSSHEDNTVVFATLEGMYTG